FRDGGWAQIQPVPAWSDNWTSDCFVASATIPTGPGRSDKAIKCPVVGPGRHWLDLRPASVAEGARLLKHLQQSAIKCSDLGLGCLYRPAAQMGWHPHPRALELALKKKAQ